MHRVDDSHIDVVARALLRGQRVGDDADHFAPGLDHGVSHGAHHSNAAAAVDQSNSALGHGVTQRPRLFAINFPRAYLRAAKDANPFYHSFNHHLSNSCFMTTMFEAFVNRQFYNLSLWKD